MVTVLASAVQQQQLMGPWRMLLPCPCPSCAFLCHPLGSFDLSPRPPSFPLHFQALLHVRTYTCNRNGTLLQHTFCKGPLPFRASRLLLLTLRLSTFAKITAFSGRPIGIAFSVAGTPGLETADAYLSCPESGCHSSHHVCVREAPAIYRTISARKCRACLRS